MWEQVNSFYFMVKEAAEADPQPELASFFAEVKMASHQFAGVMAATMSHNEAWHFGRMGRSIERADKTTRILDVKYFIVLPGGVGSPLDELHQVFKPLLPLIKCKDFSVERRQCWIDLGNSRSKIKNLAISLGLMR